MGEKLAPVRRQRAAGQCAEFGIGVVRLDLPPVDEGDVERRSDDEDG